MSPKKNIQFEEDNDNDTLEVSRDEEVKKNTDDKENRKLILEKARLSKLMKAERLRIQRQQFIEEEIEKRLHERVKGMSIKDKQPKKKVIKYIEEDVMDNEEPYVEEEVVIKKKKPEVIKEFPAKPQPYKKPSPYDFL